MAQRALVFLFGVLSYLAALAAFAWLVAFCGDAFVRSGADAASGGGWAAVATDVGLLALFGLQHSVMARPHVKRRIGRLVPPAAQRSLFVLLAAAALALLLWQWRPLPGMLWAAASGWLHVLLTGLMLAAWLTVLACTFLVGHFDLLGLRQVTLHLRGVPYEPLPFTESGAFGVVRHPLMLAFLAAFWVAPLMSLGHALLALGMSAYILVGTAFEERDLERAFGDTYRRYRARVPKLVPRPGGTVRRASGGPAGEEAGTDV